MGEVGHAILILSLVMTLAAIYVGSALWEIAKAIREHN